MNVDFKKGDGLVPAIVQHDVTEQVLMLGYMNQDALDKSLKSKKVTFYSRSKQRLWTKGETSENYLNLISIDIDCDKDTLLVRAIPNGPTCHLGTTSCFGDKGPEGLGFLGYLQSLISKRKTADQDTSYTAKLLNGPLEKIAQKVGEEGVETALAAVVQSDERIKSEVADLLYHLLVLLTAKDITLTDVIRELVDRHGDK